MNFSPAELIRAELFSIERLEQHAESLAQAQRVTLKRFKGHAILARVKDNSRVLSASHRRMIQNIKEERMRALRILSVLLLLSVIAFAADSPFTGTWKLNLQKSKMIEGDPTQSDVHQV